MKSFAAALTIIMLLTAFLIFNSLYIGGVCDELLALIDRGELESACEKWDENRVYLGFFIKDSEIDAADICVRELAYALSTGDEKAASEQLIALVDAIGEIKSGASPDINGIF